MLLNDVPANQRLAYMLRPTFDRYHRKGKPRRAVRLAVLGAGTLVLLFIWVLLQGH